MSILSLEQMEMVIDALNSQEQPGPDVAETIRAYIELIKEVSEDDPVRSVGLLYEWYCEKCDGYFIGELNDDGSNFPHNPKCAYRRACELMEVKKT